METDQEHDVPCTQACDAYKSLLPAFSQDDCVKCSFCHQPMIPNLSTEDEDGYAWSCITGDCSDYRGDEVETEDLEACGCPMWLASRITTLVEYLQEKYVPKSWNGLLTILNDIYPEAVFDGSSGDIGSQLVVLARKLEQAEAALVAVKGVVLAETQRANDAETALAAERERAERLKATMHKVIPFIGWEASVPDLVEEACEVSDYGVDEEDSRPAPEGE